MFTEIEGDWDAVMDVVKRATFVLAEKGIRTEVVLKADIRPGFSEMMDGKIDRLNEALNAQPVASPQPKPATQEDVQSRVTAALGRFGVRK